MSELRKAKSPGLVSSVNAAGLGAAVTRRRFHAAAAAFIHPARSPTRRSGLGAVGDMSNFVAVAQAAMTVPNASRTSLDLTGGDRKSTRLNSSHSQISYAVFCLKKKKNDDIMFLAP